MVRVTKSERVGVMVKILTENPNHVYTLKYFKELFSCAKSTLSEDLDMINKVFEQFSLGRLETISGASGGVVYRPHMTPEQIQEFCNQLCEKLKEEQRIIPGGYLYTNDILYFPDYASKIGTVLATHFADLQIDYVVAMEMKGIPIAQMTARVLNKPMIIVRRNNKVTEGTAININYVSGSTKRIETMSLAKRAIEKNSSVLFIDDFMGAGGTARGIQDLMKEFECEVKGIGVLISTEQPKVHTIPKSISLLTLQNIDELEREVQITPSL